jgi:endo-cleaving rubber dioxygenase
VPYAQADAPAEEQKLIYDTSYWSQTNTGHTFGDALTDAERRSVIEYLKTL